MRYASPICGYMTSIYHKQQTTTENHSSINNKKKTNQKSWKYFGKFV